jgi:YidC/Oxa1 family membrane protein insertase
MIKMEASDGRRRITKTYTIPEEKNGPYCFDLEIQIDGDASGLWLSSGVPDVELVGGSYTPQLKYQVRTSRGTDVEEIKLPKAGSNADSMLSPYWISNCNGFLGLIIDPLTPMASGYQVQKINGADLPTRLSTIDAAHRLYPAENYPGYMTLLPLKNGTTSFRVFAGPYDEALLKELDALYADPTTNYNPEYTQSISIQGWFSFISEPFSKFLFFLMQLFYAITSSWAVSIVLLTIALRAMMYPLNNWSIRSSVKTQEVAPKVKAIQERYKKDPTRAQKETMLLYKESGVNPFSGCLPMLLQIPFLMGMFYMLKSSFPLRGAPFIGGWIDDLASPDILFTWNTPIWLIGTELHLLPILTGVVMFIQGKMTQKLPKDGTPLTDAQKQQKMMGITMAILFSVMFYNVSSGLNIYFMISTLLGIAQQKLIMRKLKK